MPATNKTKSPANPVYQSEEMSTRELILQRSLELINEKGMVDFRIDTLATSLGLSPGNITYHFSRKEDICVALWERYLEEYALVTRSMTTLLDIKQLYIINRVNVQINYKYRGVVIFRNADKGAMSRDAENGRTNQAQHHENTLKVIKFLTLNGYLEKGINPLILKSMDPCHFILTRWGVNFAFQAYKPNEVNSKLDYLALLSIHALYPILTQKGKDEFAEIMLKVKSGNLLGEKENRRG